MYSAQTREFSDHQLMFRRSLWLVGRYAYMHQTACLLTSLLSTPFSWPICLSLIPYAPSPTFTLFPDMAASPPPTIATSPDIADPELLNPDKLIVVEDDLADMEIVLARGQTLGVQGSSPGVSNAPLDLDTLKTVLSRLTPAGQTVSTEWTNITHDGTTVRYIVGPDLHENRNKPLADYYSIEIRVFSDTASATLYLKQFLSGFQNINAQDQAVQAVTTARLGDYAFRTPGSVFWIRGESIFVHIEHLFAQPAPSGPSFLLTSPSPLCASW